MIVYFIYGVVLRCSSFSCKREPPHCRVLQYVHGLLMVGCESDKNLNPSRWGMMYGSKVDLILNAMVGLGFTTLMIFTSCVCLLGVQS